jgi:DNA modification methylase
MTTASKPTIWEHCYDDGWQGFITKESFAHPAKYSRGLIERIFDHMLTRGWLHKGDVVADCFGGIATGGIVAAYRGLRWYGVELEPRFVGFARANIALHKSKLEYLGRPLPMIVRGDSRKFAQIVGEIAGVVTSPPYAETKTTAGNVGNATNNAWGKGKQLASAQEGYGAAPGQIGWLKSGSVDAVVSSPPFRDARSDTTKAGATKGGGPCAERLHSVQAGTTYGKSDGQIDNLATGDVHAVVTSPPWEKNCEGDIKRHKVNFLPDNGKGHYASPAAKERAMQKAEQKVYGDTDGQIGQETKESYWMAMKLVYAQCHLAIKPGGYIAVVIKDYVKDKQRVPLCDDTVKLLEHLGFELVERVHAMLVKETRHGDLFNGHTTSKTERKSFFRRLAESKGSPPIDFEQVIFCRKPSPTP